MQGLAPASFAGSFASRAIAKAIRFAAEPPPHRLPEKPGQQTASASHLTTASSIDVAAGADRHDVTFWLSAAASNSPSAPTGSPEPATYPKNLPVDGRPCSAIILKSCKTSRPRPSWGQERIKSSVVCLPLVTG